MHNYSGHNSELKLNLGDKGRISIPSSAFLDSPSVSIPHSSSQSTRPHFILETCLQRTYLGLGIFKTRWWNIGHPCWDRLNPWVGSREGHLSVAQPTFKWWVMTAPRKERLLCFCEMLTPTHSGLFLFYSSDCGLPALLSAFSFTLHPCYKYFLFPLLFSFQVYALHLEYMDLLPKCCEIPSSSRHAVCDVRVQEALPDGLKVTFGWLREQLF